VKSELINDEIADALSGMKYSSGKYTAQSSQPFSQFLVHRGMPALSLSTRRAMQPEMAVVAEHRFPAEKRAWRVFEDRGEF
jgi:hypothetical protein